MINYTYKIVDKSVTTTNGMADVIIAVHWYYTGTTEHGLTASTFKTTFFTPPQYSDFVKFEKIDDNTIINWLEQKEDIETMKQDIYQRIIVIANNLPI